MWSKGFRGTTRGGGGRGNIPQRPGKDKERNEEKEEREEEEEDEEDEEDEKEEDEVSDWEMTPKERRRFRETGVRPARNPDGPPRRHGPTAAERAALASNPSFNFNIWTEERQADTLLDDVRKALHNGVDEDGTDEALRQLIADSYFSLSKAARPDESGIVNGAVQWMGLTGRMDPRQAIHALAQASWDYQLATQRTLEEEETSAPFREVKATGNQGPTAGAETDSDSELSMGPDEPEEGQDRLKLMRRLNPQINKDAARKGHRDDALLTITLKNPGGKADSVYQYALMVHGTIDFSSAARIRALNRWRSQIFRRNLGVARPPRIRFHDLEKRFLFDAHIDFERQRRAAGQETNWSRMNWDQVTRDFNARFEGQILPDNSNVRPHRTKDSLRTERSRIKDITDYTGIKPRDKKQAPGESGEDEEDPQPPKYPRRGDPAPGKPPMRRPDDDDESDFEGGELGAGRGGIAA